MNDKAFILIGPHLVHYEIAPGQFIKPGEVVEVSIKEAKTQVEAGNATLINNDDLVNYDNFIKKEDPALVAKDKEIADLRKMLLANKLDESKDLEIQLLQDNLSKLKIALGETEAELNKANDNVKDLQSQLKHKTKEMAVTSSKKGGK